MYCIFKCCTSILKVSQPTFNNTHSVFVMACWQVMTNLLMVYDNPNRISAVRCHGQEINRMWQHKHHSWLALAGTVTCI